MTHRIVGALALVLLLAGAACAQVRIVRTEQLPAGTAHHWMAPVFSPDGSCIYYTSEGFRGIWEYTVARRTVRQITADERAGYGFAIAPDGRRIAYRRTAVNAKTRRRTQEIVVRSLVDGSSVVQASGPGLSLPSFAGSNAAVVYSDGKQVRNLAKVAVAAPPAVLGIENTKIVLLVDGSKRLLDPLGNGSYIWPVLSPDRTRLAAYEMDRGAFVCDLRGAVQSRLGRCDAPSWTHDGKWLVYMDDRDDGHAVRSSDLYCITPDGARKVRLTETPDVLEMNPACSPAGKQIVCSTFEGTLLLLSYEEAGQ